MERKEFLELCHTVSCLPEGVLRIKKGLKDEHYVVYGGVRYYPIGYKMLYESGTIRHIAILHSVLANSVTEVELGKVEKGYVDKQEKV